MKASENRHSTKRKILHNLSLWRPVKVNIEYQMNLIKSKGTLLCRLTVLWKQMTIFHCEKVHGVDKCKFQKEKSEQGIRSFSFFLSFLRSRTKSLRLSRTCDRIEGKDFLHDKVLSNDQSKHFCYCFNLMVVHWKKNADGRLILWQQLTRLRELIISRKE